MTSNTKKAVPKDLIDSLELELELPQFTGHFDLLEQGHRLQ